MSGPRLAVLLRAVNVGGRNRLPMAELVAALTERGHRDVSTYIQSGNVVLAAGDATPAAVASTVETVIADVFGLHVRAVGRTHAELAEVVDADVFGDLAEGTARTYVGFLDRVVEPDAVGRLDPDAVAPDRFVVRGDHVFLHYRDGAGRSRLTTDLLERRLGAVVTVRNWNTVMRLHQLTAPSP